MSHASAASLAWPFEAYCAVRNRLPQVSFGGKHDVAETLGDIADPYELILLDAYGVLNVGESAILGAPERVAALRRAGKRVMVVSNSAGYPKRVMMDRYARLGFDFSFDEVVSSREALLARLSDSAVRRWGLMLGPACAGEDFERFSIEFLADDPSAYERCEGFLLVGSEGWTESRQALLEAAMQTRPRPVLVGNPDIAAPREGGLSREPGHFAHRLADRTGVVPEFFGKSFPGIYEIALSRLSPRPDLSRVLMVGDTLHTDILGGRLMGFATALVTDYGGLAGADIDAGIAVCGIRPDFVIRRP